MGAAYGIAADTGQDPSIILWGKSYPELLLWLWCSCTINGEWTVEPAERLTAAAEVAAQGAYNHESGFQA